VSSATTATAAVDLEFNPVVTAVGARVEPISINYLFTQLAAFEQCMKYHGGGSQPSANVAVKGGRGNNSNNRGGGRGGFGRSMTITMKYVKSQMLPAVIGLFGKYHPALPIGC
jgi:hypothetical protein